MGYHTSKYDRDVCPACGRIMPEYGWVQDHYDRFLMRCRRGRMVVSGDKLLSQLRAERRAKAKAVLTDWRFIALVLAFIIFIVLMALSGAPTSGSIWNSP